MIKRASNKVIFENMFVDNIEMVGRLRTAAEYQKKAICALLPSGMESHVDVISNELKLMVKEMAAGLIMECVNSSKKESETESQAESQKKTQKEKKSGSRKIDIG